MRFASRLFSDSLIAATPMLGKLLIEADKIMDD